MNRFRSKTRRASKTCLAFKAKRRKRRCREKSSIGSPGVSSDRDYTIAALPNSGIAFLCMSYIPVGCDLEPRTEVTRDEGRGIAFRANSEAVEYKIWISDKNIVGCTRNSSRKVDLISGALASAGDARQIIQLTVNGAVRLGQGLKERPSGQGNVYNIAGAFRAGTFHHVTPFEVVSQRQLKKRSF